MRLAVSLAGLAMLSAIGCSSRNGSSDAGSDASSDDAEVSDSPMHGEDAGSDAPLPDAPPEDAGEIPDGGPVIPAPPVLGAQLDRAGRPMIGTVLIGVFADEPARAAARDIYDRAADPATWRTTLLRQNVTIEDEIELNLARFDAIDKGLMVPGQTLTGCQNSFAYSQPPGPTSYQAAAKLFADDQLYIDTSKPACEVYLSLEIEVASGGQFPHAACGGRAPGHDVVDVTYSVIAAGLDGLERVTRFSGRIRDDVGGHGDVTATFPFLGTPH